MDNFWDSSVWSSLILVAVLLLSLLVANILRRGIPFLRNSLIPTSVLGGALLLGVEAIYHAVTGVGLFENEITEGGKKYTLVKMRSLTEEVRRNSR